MVEIEWEASSVAMVHGSATVSKTEKSSTVRIQMYREELLTSQMLIEDESKANGNLKKKFADLQITIVM